MSSTNGAWEALLAGEREQHLAEFFEFLRIPSVSALPAHLPDIERAANWTADRLRRAGVPEVEILPTGGKPLVWGRWHVADDQPTALIYAHYDVQPPDPLDLWTTPPFEPTIRDGTIYARGSADDKNGVLQTILATEALARTRGQPPINLVFFFEGEEEIGSPSVAPFISAARDRLACDWVISADGLMWGVGQPSLTVSTKGMCACEVHLRTANTDMHSGVYGAFVGNAAQAMAHLVASLHTPDGRVAVAGFYDRVREPTAEERAEAAKVPFDEEAIRKGLDSPGFWGEPGYSPLERSWLRPTLDVNGIWGGFQGDGKKTVTPAEAHAKITCRLVPDQDPAEILDLIERHAAAHTPTGASVTFVRQSGRARPFAISRDNPALVTAGETLRGLTGQDPLIIRLGGTLPIAEVFHQELGAEMVFYGFGSMDCNAHAPNEWLRVEDFHLGVRAYCAYLTALAR
ncbi:MAG TPA: dipeptidase [Thermomicrobiales bacterium]|nr:dipeptidase [Thermomicrobiales bacterium]